MSALDLDAIEAKATGGGNIISRATVLALATEVRRLQVAHAEACSQRDNATAALGVRWAMRAEIEEALGVPDLPPSDEALAAALHRIRELRTLPVLATCGQCADFGLDSQRERDGGWCEHREIADEDTATRASSASAAPPSWCPLRKETP